jgi:hypothetical protein
MSPGASLRAGGRGLIVMVSKVEKKRKEILKRVNNQARLLEKKSPLEASELNDRLWKVVEWIAVRLAK